MKVLYEFPAVPWGFIIAFAAGFMFIAVRGFIKRDEKYAHSKIAKLIGWVFTGIGVFLIAAQIFSFVVVAINYHKGGWQEVSGVVEHYRLNGSNESFTVDGVYFHYNSHTILPFYTNIQGAGGVITGDGQRVLIRYYPVEKGEESAIVMIAELTEPQVSGDGSP